MGPGVEFIIIGLGLGGVGGGVSCATESTENLYQTTQEPYFLL